MDRLWRFLLLLFIFPAVVPSCHLAAQVNQGQTANIVGEMRLERGAAPDARIEVTLQTHGLFVATSFTDGNGNFHFAKLDAGLYHVIVNAERYDPVDIEVEVNPLFSTMNRVVVTLRPKQADKSKDEKAVAGGNPNLVSPAEYRAHYPKDALKQFEQGVKAEKKNRREEALRHYQRAVELAPQFYAARNNLGLAYMAKADFANARQQFEKVISINPADTEAYFNLGNVYLLTNNLPQAGQTIQEGLQRQPDSAFGKFLLGSVYSRTGNQQGAEKLFTDCLRLDPSMHKAHLALVNLYLQEQRKDDAIAQLRAFLKDAPADPMAAQVKQVLSRLENGGAAAH